MSPWMRAPTALKRPSFLISRWIRSPGRRAAGAVQISSWVQMHAITRRSRLELLGKREAEAVIADKGYDSDKIVEQVEKTMQAQAAIPTRSNRKQQRDYDKALYKLRNRIERCFSKLKQFRRFATRYEKSLKPASLHSSHLPAHGFICSYMSIRPNPCLIVPCSSNP